ncbi:MAG: tRNA (guanosine(37)-N1)-methyltransferase TrmD [Actinomycetaceae bacterium]|nr:tRNA (guanosine(37)-N1)-methyltransferase TrmD [Actinomycetaceae bacterium]
MRIDVLTIFPQYFDVLSLSLLGKAQFKNVDSGGVSFGIHDLRQWTTDRHHSVDDSPYGGGAGMVMRADVWGKGLDAVLANAGAASDATGQRVVLAIPTPSGEPLTQKRVEELTDVTQLVIACGRYEGIDYRVVEEYQDRADVQVWEYSIGDYVLNGGEVAALVLIEAVTRLREGFMSNPQSLEEESFTDQLLEYPAYTRPPTWREREVPAVLRSGDHARIQRWRRQQSLRRTARRRPDLVQNLNPRSLTVEDKEELISCGWVHNHSKWQEVTLREAQENDLAKLVALAQRTFPDACPDHLPAQAINEHVQSQLNTDAISQWLADPDTVVLVAQINDGEAGELVGYTMARNYAAGGGPADVPKKFFARASSYLSKCYVDRSYRGTGVAGALVEATVTAVVELACGAEGEAEDTGRPVTVPTKMVVGTNRGNGPAIALYRRHGFKRRGRRVFEVGGIRNEDVVLVRAFASS